MGYTTKFKGEFKITPPLPAEKIVKWMQVIDDDEPIKYEGERLRIQWTINPKGDTVKWDRGEKFYEYEKCLKYCIEHFVFPSKINGEVKYQGEDRDDYGSILVVDNKIMKFEGSPLFECPHCKEKIEWEYIRQEARKVGEWEDKN